MGISEVIKAALAPLNLILPYVKVQGPFALVMVLVFGLGLCISIDFGVDISWSWSWSWSTPFEVKFQRSALLLVNQV